MGDADRYRLRQRFDEDAERYDRARPGYPPELFDDLAALAGIGPGARVLEIGPGTGQATRPLAERGYRVVAVELGAQLAGVARRNLTGFPGVRVDTDAFETWPLPAEPFDLVLCATAWHWIDPAVRVVKASRALCPGGALAIVETHHVAGRDGGFFARSQDCYLRFDPGATPGFRQPEPVDVRARAPGLATADAAGGTSAGAAGEPPDGLDPGAERFAPAVVRRYLRDVTYSTAEYLDVLLTYSNHRDLPAGDQAGLLDCVARLADGEFGGRVRKRYLTQLSVARLLT